MAPDVTSRTLAELPPGARGRVCAVALEPGETAWLRAVGVSVGEELTVLRRAPWGGPLHVRSGAGGEFAVDRALARFIQITPNAEGSP